MLVTQFENIYASRTIEVPEKFEEIMSLYLETQDSLETVICEQYNTHPLRDAFDEWMQNMRLNWDPSPSECSSGDDDDWGFTEIEYDEEEDDE